MRFSRVLAGLVSTVLIVGPGNPAEADDTGPADFGGFDAPPVVSATITTPQPGTVAVAWAINETGAELSEGCADRQFAGDGDHAVTCIATDRSGDVGSATVGFKIAGTKPVIASTVSGSTGTNGWYSSDVTVKWTIMGGKSGIDAARTVGCSDETVPAVNGVYHPACSVTDNLGNTESRSVTFKIDTDDPTIVLTLESEATPNNGWYTAPVTVRWTVSDELSGVARTGGCNEIVVPSIESTGLLGGFGHSATCGAIDAAGNRIIRSVAVLVDLQPPAVAGSPGNPTGTNGWFRTPARVDWTIIETGSGVATFQGCLENWIEEDGIWTRTCTVADRAGHVMERSVTVKVDQTPPSVTCPPADSAWLADNVTVSCTVEDATSGALERAVSLSTSVEPGSESTDAYTGTARAHDLAGNFVLVGPLGPFRVDRKAPVDVTFAGGPADRGVYDFGSLPPAPTCTAADGGSGLAACVVSGYARTPGTHTITATATDNVGNSSSVTRTYSVRPWTLHGFYQPVDMSGVWNTVKSGATLPLAFEIFDGPTEITDPAAVLGFAAKGVPCPGASAPSDDVEFTTTGNTVLHYDMTSGRFVQKWQTPRNPGACYTVTMTAADGSVLSANIKLK